MFDFDVVAAVSKTLETFLTSALSTVTPPPAPQAVVHDLQSAPSTTPPKLTLYLYEVVEDPSARNRPRSRATTPAAMTSRKPPMALLLRYLMTPWSGDPPTDHKILGRTLQVLYDHPIISGPDLQDGLANTDQALKVTMAPLTLEERTRVWQAIQQKYRLSTTYEVRVVNLDVTSERTEAPVRSRSLDRAVPVDVP